MEQLAAGQAMLAGVMEAGALTSNETPETADVFDSPVAVLYHAPFQ